MTNREVLRFPQGAGVAVAAPAAHVIRDWQLMHHIPGRLRLLLENIVERSVKAGLAALL